MKENTDGRSSPTHAPSLTPAPTPTPTPSLTPAPSPTPAPSLPFLSSTSEVYIKLHRRKALW